MSGHGASYALARSVIGGYELHNVLQNTQRVQSLFKQLDGMNDPIRVTNGRASIRPAAMEAIDKTAETIAKDAFVRDLDAEQEYRDLRRATAGKYYLSQQDRHDLTDFNARSSMVKTTTDRSATSIDSLYQEVSEAYPHRFSGVTHPADQLREMNSVLHSLRDSSRPLSAEMRRDTQNAIASDLMRYYYLSKH